MLILIIIMNHWWVVDDEDEYRQRNIIKIYKYSHACKNVSIKNIFMFISINEIQR